MTLLGILKKNHITYNPHLPKYKLFLFMEKTLSILLKIKPQKLIKEMFKLDFFSNLDDNFFNGFDQKYFICLKPLIGNASFTIESITDTLHEVYEYLKAKDELFDISITKLLKMTDWEYQQNYALMEKMLSTYDICKINIIKHFSILSHLIINWLNKISK